MRLSDFVPAGTSIATSADFTLRRTHERSLMLPVAAEHMLVGIVRGGDSIVVRQNLWL